MTVPQGAACLIIVPGDQAEACRRLTAHFASDARITVRLDGRTGARASSAVALFAVGGGPLDSTLRAHVEAQIRLALTP